jgi:hypothetical protein
MAAKDTAAATTSPEEKAKVDNADSCEQQATQKGLKGKDRKAFMKNLHGWRRYSKVICSHNKKRSEALSHTLDPWLDVAHQSNV